MRTVVFRGTKRCAQSEKFKHLVPLSSLKQGELKVKKHSDRTESVKTCRQGVNSTAVENRVSGHFLMLPLPTELLRVPFL